MKKVLMLTIIFISMLIFASCTIKEDVVSNSMNKSNYDQNTKLNFTPTITVDHTTEIETSNSAIISTPVPSLTPAATDDPKSFYIEFDVQKYDYTFIDENHYSLWTKKDWFAYAMRRMQQDVEYSFDDVLVSFTSDNKEFSDPDLLIQNGLVLNGRIRQYGDQNKYWTDVELINKSKEGIRNAIIQLNQDNNVDYVQLDIIVPLID